MSKTPDRIRLEELAHKWLTGQLSGDEQREFHAWLDQINDEPLKMPVSFGESEEQHERELFIKIQSLISGTETRPADPRWKLPVTWRRAAAAAAVILLAGSGLFFLVREQASAPPSKTVYENDVAPGGNRAYLTLSGGKRIALTDASDGILATQMGVEVTKAADGELVYGLTEKDRAPARIEYNTIETPKGGQYMVRLPDGSSVWLNSASTITFPVAFPAGERSVKISGEGYFEVYHDPGRPFRVDIAGQMQVEVLGTSFNVTAYPDEKMIRTTLLDGSVQVSRAGVAGEEKDVRYPALVPGQQARLYVEASGKPPRLDIVRLKHPEEASAWRRGLISFRNANIESIMRQLSRWYNLEVNYKGNIPERYYSGTIKRNANLSEALEMLYLVSGAKFEIRGRQITVEVPE